ncbi:uncharacterized protein LOC122849521 [Aphidius gifuensis]|uniref:uncharacterized protein LOC122849521 n=1 Tax=Aphidius gifuensis TaxID=684658 RepID=UPI001CDC3D4E|nr:uncharacterized protein LOC122849521 [Aphidius gifuensis]
MLGLFRLPILKSVKIAQFGVKSFARLIPRVLKKSYGSSRSNGQRVVYGLNQSFWEFNERINPWLTKVAFRVSVVSYSFYFLIYIIMAFQEKPAKEYVEDITYS